MAVVSGFSGVQKSSTTKKRNKMSNKAKISQANNESDAKKQDDALKRRINLTSAQQLISGDPQQNQQSSSSPTPTSKNMSRLPSVHQSQRESSMILSPINTQQ